MDEGGGEGREIREKETSPQCFRQNTHEYGDATLNHFSALHLNNHWACGESLGNIKLEVN